MMKTVLILKATAGGDKPAEAMLESAGDDVEVRVIDLSREPLDESAIIQAVFAADAAHVW